MQQKDYSKILIFLLTYLSSIFFNLPFYFLSLIISFFFCLRKYISSNFLVILLEPLDFMEVNLVFYLICSQNVDFSLHCFRKLLILLIFTVQISFLISLQLSLMHILSYQCSYLYYPQHQEQMDFKEQISILHLQ